ncbi:arylformamidase [Lachancea thermotolerans CBS 6340]|uniref:KLTH0G03938p n=1 Tax=Lachancea thermotolerans (strain ATCC 56472 / CBS 6340 / NRRL Y-8284) TaxID=559295 RepID=C5DLV9_LACTC|nr:KLTH0G03938p [Lachancea thermotolerans CBS 6340]CAR24770.1 KLTH0G03938p [Lachancea thermotolerans CBS 6340]
MAKFEETVTFYRSQQTSPVHCAIVFIHGGAWIDKNNTPHDFDEFSRCLLDLANGNPSFSIYAIEYRLSPAVKHPAHIYDVIENLVKLVEQEGIEELNLMGHSVGATLVWQVLSGIPGLANAESFASSAELKLLRKLLKKCYLVDGIYSLSKLLEEYPSYDYFVSQAFEQIEDYDDPEQSQVIIPLNADIYVIHSYRDELLSPLQSNYLCATLQKLKQPFQSYWSDFGEHNEVYSNAKVAQYILHTMQMH